MLSRIMTNNGGLFGRQTEPAAFSVDPKVNEALAYMAEQTPAEALSKARAAEPTKTPEAGDIFSDQDRQAMGSFNIQEPLTEYLSNLATFRQQGLTLDGFVMSSVYDRQGVNVHDEGIKALRAALQKGEQVLASKHGAVR